MRLVGKIGLMLASLLIALFWARAALAYVEVDRGPGWVVTYQHYFDELNEFNRTHPCVNDDDLKKASEIWIAIEKDIEDDIYWQERRITADEQAITDLDAKIAGIKANYEAALQVSTHTVHDPSDWISQLEREKAGYVADKDAAATRINLTHGIEQALHEIYVQIQHKPLCYEPPPQDPPPPPVYVGRCKTLPHVAACKPCKPEVDQVNNAIDRLAWSFGTAETCWTRELVVRDLKKSLAACEAAKCGGKRVGYLPGHDLREGEAYVSYDGNKWCTFGSGVATTAMLMPVDEDSGLLFASAAPGVPDRPGVNASPVPRDGGRPRLVGSPVRDPTSRTSPDQPGSGKNTSPDLPTPVTELTPPAPDDTPSDIPDNVELKVKREVVEEGQTGEPIEGQTVKLMLAEKPSLPVPVDPKKSVPARTAADRGFDKPTSQCITDASGTCSIAVAGDDRSPFHLPELPKGQHAKYRLEIAQPLQSGIVAEIKPGTDLNLPQGRGSRVAANIFRIGDRTFARLALEEVDGEKLPLRDSVPSREEDICREKYPDLSSVSETLQGADLPGAILRLAGPPE